MVSALIGDSLTPLEDCARCPRLCEERRQIKFSYPSYHASPVGSWGDRRARILLVGLAPGLHGAAKTGRAFVGDSSGDFLFASLKRVGIADSRDPLVARLSGARITNAVKCYPPGNLPTSMEIHNCLPFLRAELSDFSKLRSRLPRSLVVLGGVAHRAVFRSLGMVIPSFQHGIQTQVNRRLRVFDCFHPSRLNVNTKKLSEGMLDDVLERAKRYAFEV